MARLLFSQKRLVKTTMHSYSDVTEYEVPVEGVFDWDRIRTAFAASKWCFSPNGICGTRSYSSELRVYSGRTDAVCYLVTTHLCD